MVFSLSIARIIKKMNIRKKIIVFGIGLSLFFLSVGNSVNAQWNPDSLNVFNLSGAKATDIIASLALWLLGICALFGIIGFIVSGIMYLISTGNEEMITKAKKAMMYSIVGVIIGMSGLVIVKAVTAMLSGSSFIF